MRRLLLLLMLIPFVAAAKHFPIPAKLDKGVTVIDSVPGTCSRALIEAQIAIERSHHTVRWSLLWNCIDGDNYNAVTFHIPAVTNDEVYGSNVEVDIVKMTGGVRTVIRSFFLGKGIDLGGGFNGARLRYDGFAATLSVGSSDPIDLGTVDFDPSCCVAAVYASEPVFCRTFTADFLIPAHHCRAPFSSVDALIDHLRQSTDPNEGLWEYLDRNMDAASASLGGYYRLATVRNGDGYDIVYLGGDTANPTLWQPLDIKGTLTSTIFVDNFSLTWIDSAGHLLTAEQDATLDQNASILTLRLPLFRTTLRFSRLLLPAL